MSGSEYWEEAPGEFYWIGPEVAQSYMPERGWHTLSAAAAASWQRMHFTGDVMSVDHLPEGIPEPPLKGLHPPEITVTHGDHVFVWRSFVAALGFDTEWLVDGETTTVGNWFRGRGRSGLRVLEEVQLAGRRQLLESGRCDYESMEDFGATFAGALWRGARRMSGPLGIPVEGASDGDQEAARGDST